jgi:Flp pilus assembly protein TadD
MRVVRYVCLVVCCFTGTNGYGQFSSAKANMTEFRGRLVEGGVDSYSDLVVEVTNVLDRSIRQHADVASDGSFGFRSIPEGDYQIRVLTLYEDELVTTMTSVGPSALPFEIRMPHAKLQKPVSGTISLQQLNHPPSKQVRKLLESGHRLIQDQNYADAAQRFSEAARDAPDCLQAHADLGMALSKMGAWESAAKEYRAAVSLAPKDSVLRSNLGAALAASNHLDEAETEAQTALKLDPRNPRAHFVMAGVVLRKRGPLTDAVSHLVAAQGTVPSARAAVEQICAANHVQGCPP